MPFSDFLDDARKITQHGLELPIKKQKPKPISSNSTSGRVVISGRVGTAVNRYHGAIENSARKSSRKITADV
jgi:hypothetical protein